MVNATHYDRYGRPRQGSATLGDNPIQLRDGDLIADRELCLDADGKPVEVKDPAKRTLLVTPGRIVPREKAAELGLRVEDGKIAWGEAKAEKPAAKADGSNSKGRK